MAEPDVHAYVRDVTDSTSTVGDEACTGPCGDEGTNLSIHPLHQHKPFEPEAIAMMTRAYADVCHTLGVNERNREETNIVAKAVIEFVQRGVRDPIRLRDHVLEVLRDEDRGAAIKGRPRGI